MQKQTVDISYESILRVILVLFVLFFLFYLRHIIFIVFISVIVALIANPAVDNLQKRKIPRVAGASALFLTVFLVIGLLAYIVAPPLAKEVSQLTSQFPTYLEQIDFNNTLLQDQYFNFTVIVQDDDLTADKEEVLKFWKNTIEDNFILDSWTGEVVFLPSQIDVGEFVVMLSVSDKSDTQDTIELIIHVNDANDPPPTPTLSVVPKVNNPLEINAMVTAFPILDPDDDEIVCIWDFGDGSDPIVDFNDDTKWQVEHTYSQPGLYIISLTLDDSRGGVVTVERSLQVGEEEDDIEPEESTSLGMQGKETEEDSDIWMILIVLVVVIVVILIAIFNYISSGKKLIEVKEEEDDDDLLELEMGVPGMMGMGGMGMHQYPGMPGYGMYGQYWGYPMFRDGTMYGQPGMQVPGLPAIGTIHQAASGGIAAQPPAEGPRLMLPPASQFNICPQCNQAAIQFLNPDGSSFACTNCGYKV